MDDVFTQLHQYSVASPAELNFQVPHYPNPLAIYVDAGRIFDPNEYPRYTAQWILSQIRNAILICGQITKEFVIDQYSVLKQGLSAIPHQFHRFTNIPWILFEKGTFYYQTVTHYTGKFQTFQATILTPASKQLLRNLRSNKSFKILYTLIIPFTIFVCARRFYYVKHDKLNEISVQGKVVVITGAGSGIGERLAMEFIKRGATVILVGRSIHKLLYVAHNGFNRLRLEKEQNDRHFGLDNLQVMSDEDGPVYLQGSLDNDIVEPDDAPPYVYKIHWIQMDFGDITSIWRGVYKLFDIFPKIDIIINNAAIRVPVEEACETYDGLEVHFGVNYVGHYIFTNAILSYCQLPLTSTVKIVNVLCKEAFMSGYFGQQDIEYLRRSFDGKHLQNPYSTSKLMQYLFHIELTKQLERAGPGGFRVYAVCPAECNTNLFRFYERSWISKSFPSVGPKAGVQSILHCLLSPKDNVTGSYFAQCTKKVPPHTYTCRTELLASQLWDLTKKYTSQMVEKCRQDADQSFYQVDSYENVLFEDYDFYQTISRPPYLPSPKRDIIENRKKYYNPLYLTKDAIARELQALSKKNLLDYWEQLYGDLGDQVHHEQEEMMNEDLPLDLFFDTLPRVNRTNGWMYNLD